MEAETLVWRESTMTCGNLSMDSQRVKIGQTVNSGQRLVK